MATIVGLAAILAVGLAFAAVGANGGGIGILGDDADAETDTPANPGGAASDDGSDDGNAAVGESDADRDEDAADDDAGGETDASADDESSDSEASNADKSDQSDDSDASDADEETNDGGDANDGTETDSDGSDADSDVNDGGDSSENDGAGDAGASISLGERVTADANERTDYTVTASAGETVDVVASGQGGEMALYGPDGEELASAQIYADRTSFGAEAPTDGEYTLVVDAGMDPVGLTVDTATDPSNTDRSSATAVGDGDSVTADLTAGSTHWYELEGGASEVTLENLRAYIGNDVEVTLLDADGDELDSVTVGPEAVSSTSATLSDENAAYVVVRGENVEGATSYALDISEGGNEEGNENGAGGSDDANGADDAASTIPLGERVDVAADATERFAFEADAGEQLTVVASGKAGAVTLLGPDGEELNSAETTGDGVAVGATAPADGEYTVVVESGFDGVQVAADAAEPASNTDRSSAVGLSDGDARSASIPEGDEHWYAVELEAGEELEAELAHAGSTSNTQVRVEIRDPSGETQSESKADFVSGGSPATVATTADEAGTYYVVVTGLNGTSEYELELSTR